MAVKHTASSKAWKKVTEDLAWLEEAIGKHVDDVSAEVKADRAAFRKSLRGLIRAIDDSVDALSKLARDDDVRRDLAAIAGDIPAALLASLQSAGREVRDRVRPPAPARTTASKATKAPSKAPTKAPTKAPRKAAAKASSKAATKAPSKAARG